MVVILIGYLIPYNPVMPVVGATNGDFNHNSFWFHPWGKSVTHKGVDIFANKGTPLRSATRGIVLYTGQNSMGGNIIVILGPKWRLHYYAHLDKIDTRRFALVNQQSTIGLVGDSGNAKGKPPHLHYTIASVIPRVWKVDKSPQGWKKMFYINPIPTILQ